MAARNEASLLQGVARGLIVAITPGRGNRAKRTARPLQFLHEIRTESSSPRVFCDLHVQVAIRTVVVKKEATLADRSAVRDELPFAASSASFRCRVNCSARCDLPHCCTIGGQISREFVLEQYAFALNVTRPSMKHVREQRPIGLCFNRFEQAALQTI